MKKNKQLMMMSGAVMLVGALSFSAIAATTNTSMQEATATVGTISTTATTDSTTVTNTTTATTDSTSGTTTQGTKKNRKGFDTSSWTDEQKALLETAMKKDADEATRKAALDSLVSANLITSDEATRMLEGKGAKFDTSSWTDEQKALLETAMKKDADEATRKAALDSLVSANLITSDEATRMLEGKGAKFDTSSWTDEQKALLETAMKKDADEATRKAALDSLVSANLITSDEATRMLEGKGGKGAKFDTSSWTDEQKALLETAMKKDADEATRKAALDSLVSANLITSDEATRMLEGPKGGKGGKGAKFDTSSWTDEQKALLETAMKKDADEATRKAALDSLVSANLITSDEATRMLEGPKGGKGAKFDTSSWTDEQKALLETAMKKDADEATRKAALDSLVSANLITSDQATRMLEGPKGGRNAAGQSATASSAVQTTSTAAQV